MNAIPWYRSPVMVSAAVAVISQVLVILGKTDVITPELLTQKVEAFFQLVAILAPVWTLIARARSKVQPVTLTKDGANQPPPAVSLLMASVLACVLAIIAGCSTPLAVSKAQTVEQRAAALLGDFTIYQRASLKIGEDQSVPVDVRRKVLETEVAAKPIADKLDESLRDYRVIAAELANGQSTDEKLRIAAANLTNWIGQLQPLVTSLRSTVEGVSQ